MQAKVGQEKEFQVALRKLRGKDVDISHEAAEILVFPNFLQLEYNLWKNFIINIFIFGKITS